MINTKHLIGLAAAAFMVAVLLGISHGTQSLGGTFNNVATDFAGGITVKGSAFLSSARALTVTSVTNSGASSVAGAFTVTGASTVSTFTQGGGIGTVATTSTSYTLAATDFDTENIIDVTPGGASLTLTLPASSTLPLSTTAGSMRSVWLRNATTTAGINITVAGGLGDFMKSASTTFTLMSSSGTSTQARLDIVRRSNSDISVMFTPFNN